MIKYNERFTLNEETACNYIKKFLVDECLWQDVSYQANYQVPEWIFSGYMMYHGKKNKVIKVLNEREFLIILKKSLYLSKPKLIDIDTEVKARKNRKYIIKYNLDNNIVKRRRR